MKVALLAFISFTCCGPVFGQEIGVWIRAAELLAKSNFVALQSGYTSVAETPEGQVLVRSEVSKRFLVFVDVNSGKICPLSSLEPSLPEDLPEDVGKSLISRTIDALQVIRGSLRPCSGYFDIGEETAVLLLADRGVVGSQGVLANQTGLRRIDNMDVPPILPIIRALSKAADSENRPIIALSDARVAHGDGEDVIVDLFKGEDGTFVSVKICPSEVLAQRSKTSHRDWGPVYQVGLEAVFPPGRRDALAYYSC